MVVVNVVGFPYKINLRDGSSIIVPNDNQPHNVPDEIAEHKFDNVFQILVPPRPKVTSHVIFPTVIASEVQKVPEIIEITIGNDQKTEDKPKDVVTVVEEDKPEIYKPPLKGIRIKKNIRQQLSKKRKLRNTIEEINVSLQ